MDSGSSLRATFNLLRALTAKPLFRKYSACFRYNEYGIVSSSSHASKPDFLISPLRSPDPPSASSTTEIPLCLSIYWISSSDLQFSLFLQKVWLKIFLKFPILLCLAFQILLNLLELLTDSLNRHLVDYEIDVQLKTIQRFYKIALWFRVKIEVPLSLARLSHLHFGSNMKSLLSKNLHLALFRCPGLTIIYIPKNLVCPKGPLNSELKGVGTIVQELSTLPLLCMFHQEQTCLLDNISLCIKWFNKLRIDSTNCVVWYIHTYKKLVLEHAPH